jgi:ATP-dependent helicase HrpB
VDLLHDLDALDAAGAITPLGRRMTEPPLHPRLARMLVAAPDTATRRLAADLAALLSERDPWVSAPGSPRPADLTPRLEALEAQRQGRQTPGLDRGRLAGIDRLARQLVPLTRDPSTSAATQDPAALLALAYPDRVARRREEGDGRYLLACGPGATLPLDDGLAAHRYLAIAELDPKGRDGRIQLALPLEEADLRGVFAAHLVTSERVYWDAERAAVSAREETCLGAITLAARPIPLTDQAQALKLLLEQVARRFDTALPWTAPARQVQARVALLRRIDPEAGWPDLSDAALGSDLGAWLGPWLTGTQRMAEVQRLDLTQILRGTLDWDRLQRLDTEAPEALVTPAGNRRALDYGAGDGPVLAVPLQEMFGTGETPRVAGGRVAVLLHLLSPARRPVQVTRDLAGFWARGYADVRKQLRGRYPKHHWPEDPAAAVAVPGGVRRRR